MNTHILKMYMSVYETKQHNCAGLIFRIYKRKLIVILFKKIFFRPASSPLLVVRRTQLSTIGDRAFPVSAADVWNGLLHHVTSTPSLSTFCLSLIHI